MGQREALDKVIAGVVTSLGFSWVGLQYFPQRRGVLLRLYVDKPGGITIEDCVTISRQVDTVLSVESPMKGEYTLEVSSPGLDRVLFSLAQCQEQVGKRVSIRLIAPVLSKRNFKAKLDRVEGEQLCLIEDSGEERAIPFADIDEVRLVPEW